MNKLFISKEIVSGIKTFQQPKAQDHWFPWWGIPSIQRRMRTNPSWTRPQKSKRREHFQSTFPGALISKQTRIVWKEKYYSPVFLMKLDGKIHNRILANQIKKHIKMIIYHDKVGFVWKDWCWSWNSNTLAIWWEELTHLKRPWC